MREGTVTDKVKETAVEPTLTELAMEWVGMAEAAVLVSRRRNDLQDQIIAGMDAAGVDAVSVGDVVITVEPRGTLNEHRYLRQHKAAR